MPLNVPLNVATYTNEFQQVVPAHTPSLVQNVTLGFRIVDTIGMLFAQGHVALTGFRLEYDGKAIIPWDQPTSFLVGNDERRVLPLNFQVMKPMRFVFLNSDNVPHTFNWFIESHDVPVPSDNASAPALPLLTP